MTEVRFCDELGWGFGWIAAEPAFMERCSHALRVDGQVWLVDAIDGDGVEERVRSLGEPAGVIQLLDRHNRGCAAVAARMQVPHHEVPLEPIPGAPFEFVPVVGRVWWREAALWWPERRVLVTGDSLGTVQHYFALGGEQIGVHPLLRLTPPRALARYEPEHVLVGHGAGVHHGAAAAVRDTIEHSRRRAPRLPLELPVMLRRRRDPA